MPWNPETWRPAAALAILILALWVSAGARRAGWRRWLAYSLVLPFALGVAVVIQTGDPSAIRVGLLFAPIGLLLAALETLMDWFGERRRRINARRSGDYALVPRPDPAGAQPGSAPLSSGEPRRNTMLLAVHAFALLVGAVAPQLGAPTWVTFAVFYVVFVLWVFIGASSLGSKPPPARSVVERTSNGRS